MTTKKVAASYSPVVRERAVRLVLGVAAITRRSGRSWQWLQGRSRWSTSGDTVLRVKREKRHPEKTRMFSGCGSRHAHRPAACGRSRSRFRVRSTGNNGGGDSNQNDFGRLACGGHARDEGGKRFIVSFGAEGTHAECAAQALRADAADLARSTHECAGAMLTGRRPSRFRRQSRWNRLEGTSLRRRRVLWA